MDPWQREFIKENVVELLKTTICTIELLTDLLAKHTLSDENVDEITTIKKQYEKSKKLYDILVTRENGYATLLKALHNCKQTGAAKLLLDGQLNHILNSQDVNFHGGLGNLRDIFLKLETQDLLDIVRSTTLNEECIDFVCGNAECLKLIRQSVPPPPKFYIPRSVSNRLQLNPQIFKEECSDVFVFTGIEKQKLSQLVLPNFVLSSSRQLVEFNSRFIFLEDEWHWLEIRKISGRPIHLIQYEANKTSEGLDSDAYILEETIGNSEIVLKFVKSPDKRAYISEEDLLEKAEGATNAKGVCICDTPGMGKSWVLASLARKILQKYPKKLVAFISLSKFSHHLTSGDTEHTYESAVNFLLDAIATSSFTKSIMMRAVERDCLSLAVFFDGLDEVHSDFLEVTTNFLKAVVSGKSHVKVYVTSRPHVQRELESSLGVIAYNMLPFTDRNQADFLVESWKQKLEIYEEKKLKDFAKLCLQSLKDMLSNKERDIMGIPLQCFLLAEVHANEARLYSNSTYNMEAPLMKSTSIYDMYKRFMDEKFKSADITGTLNSRPGFLKFKTVRQSFQKLFRKNANDKPDLGTAFELLRNNEMKTYHLCQAFLLLFPELSDKFSFHVGGIEGLPSSTHFSFGLLEQVHEDDKGSRFVHRTFAEFLVAEFMGDILNGKHQLSPKFNDMLEFCFESVLEPLDGVYMWQKAFKHSVIASFINMNLASTINNSKSPVINKLQDFIEPSLLRNMFFACSGLGYLHLFRFLKDTLLTLPSDRLKVYRPYILCTDKYFDLELDSEVISRKYEPCSLILRLSAEHPVELIDECFRLFRGCFGYNSKLAKFLDNPSNAHIPFDIAAGIGNHEVVEYLAERFSLDGRNLLQHCIDGSYGESEDKIIKRIKIMKLLLSKNKELIQEIPFENYPHTGAFQPTVHLQLIKFLFMERKKFLLENEHWLQWQIKVIENVLMRMSPEDFIELIQFRVIECEAAQTKNDSQDSFPLIFEMARNAVQNVTDKDGNNIFLNAVATSKPLQILQELIRLGARPHHGNKNGESAIHFAAKNGNKEMVAYFQSLRLSLDRRDTFGNTSLRSIQEKRLLRSKPIGWNPQMK